MVLKLSQLFFKPRKYAYLVEKEKNNTKQVRWRISATMAGLLNGTKAGMVLVVEGNHRNCSIIKVARILRLSQFGEI